MISALLSPQGAPAKLLTRWLAGEFELVVSELVLAELERALSYPKLRTRIEAREAAALVEWLRGSAVVGTDPSVSPRRSPDPDDDYLLALAEQERAVLVSGDRHLLGLSGEFPVYSARDFLQLL